MNEDALTIICSVLFWSASTVFNLEQADSARKSELALVLMDLWRSKLFATWRGLLHPNIRRNKLQAARKTNSTL